MSIQRSAAGQRKPAAQTAPPASAQAASGPAAQPSGHRLSDLPVHSPVPASHTGLPAILRHAAKAASGVDLGHVRVHWRSPMPERLEAAAYAKGAEIHLAPGEEQYLGHEAWHLVQQAQGRVRATGRLSEGTAVNEDTGLESEADRMGAHLSRGSVPASSLAGNSAATGGPAHAPEVPAQLGKKKRKGPVAASSSTKAEEESGSDGEEPEEDGGPLTPARVLQQRFGIGDAHAKDLLEKTAHFNELKDKNQEGLKFLLTRQGRDRLTDRDLHSARGQLADYNAIAPHVGEDLAYFALHDSGHSEHYHTHAGFLQDEEFPETDKEDARTDLAASRAELSREQQRFLANQPSGGGGSSDWALSSVRSSAKRAAAESGRQELFPGGSYTIHHKVSRSRLKQLHASMDTHAGVSAPFRHKLQEIGQDDLNGASSTNKILLSLPFNLEVGPPTDHRVDDPGSGFDPNTEEDGSRTPRSKELADVDSAVDSGNHHNAAFWTDLSARLERLRGLQSEASPNGLVSAPNTGQWAKDGGNSGADSCAIGNC